MEDRAPTTFASDSVYRRTVGRPRKFACSWLAGNKRIYITEETLEETLEKLRAVKTRILVTLRALPPLRSLCCYRCCYCPYCPDRLSPFFTRVLRVTYGNFNLRLHYIMKLNGFVNNNTSRRITPLILKNSSPRFFLTFSTE